jgi:hypothetical protein
VRAELLRVLAKARAAESFPWDSRRTLYWRTVFPQMANWLPDEEAAVALCVRSGNPAPGGGLKRASLLGRRPRPLRLLDIFLR